jgi:hypothetical protein
VIAIKQDLEKERYREELSKIQLNVSTVPIE